MKIFLILPVLLFTGAANAFVVDVNSPSRWLTADGSHGYFQYTNDSSTNTGDWDGGPLRVTACMTVEVMPGYWDCVGSFDVIYADSTSTIPASGSYESYTLNFNLTTFKADQADPDFDYGRAGYEVELTFDEQVRYDFTALCETSPRDSLFELASTTPGSVSISGDFISCASSGSGILDAGTYELRAVSQNSAYMDYSVTFSAIPIPAAVWLFGSALAGLGWMRRRKAA